MMYFTSSQNAFDYQQPHPRLASRKHLVSTRPIINDIHYSCHVTKSFTDLKSEIISEI